MVYRVQMILDEHLFEKLDHGEYAGLADKICDKIADKLYPDIEKELMSDPQFKDRIMNEVLIRLANRISRKRPQNKKKKDIKS